MAGLINKHPGKHYGLSVSLIAVMSGVLSLVGLSPVFPLNHLTEPYLMDARTDGITIAWFTDVLPDTVYALYGVSPQPGFAEEGVSFPLDSLNYGTADYRSRIYRVQYHNMVTIRGLQPHTEYHYRVVSVRDSIRRTGPVYRFRTAAIPGEAFAFLVMSDAQFRPESAATLRQAGSRHADLCIWPGDLINNADVWSQWGNCPGGCPGDLPEDSLRFWNMMQQTSSSPWIAKEDIRLAQYVPLYPAPGNHEWDDQSNMDDLQNGIADDDLCTYIQMFRPLYPDQETEPGGRHWYSFDYGDVHFVSLSVSRWWQKLEDNSGDTTGYRDIRPGRYIWDPVHAGSPQYEWLKNDLASTARKYIVVFHHHSVFGTGINIWPPFGPVSSGYDPDLIHQDLVPLYEKHRVSLVLTGHDHLLEHFEVNGIHYCQASALGNTYGIHIHDEPHRRQALFSSDSVRGFLLAGVEGDTMHCRFIQGGYEMPGAGSVLHKFYILSRSAGTAAGKTADFLINAAGLSLYPNPANGSVQFRIRLPESTQINLSVFDMLGREVDCVFSGRLEAGEHGMKWQPFHLPGGIYLCRLRAGRKHIVRRFVLLN